jgi:hypothetical protein
MARIILTTILLLAATKSALADDFQLPQELRGKWCGAEHYPAGQYNKIDTTVYAIPNCKDPRAPDDSWIDVRADGFKAFETDCKIVSGFASAAPLTFFWTWGAVPKKYTVQVECFLMDEAPIHITMRMYRTRHGPSPKEVWYNLVIEDISYNEEGNQ